MTNARAESLAEQIASLRSELAQVEERQAELYRQLNSALREYRSLTVDPDDIPDPTSAKATSPAQLAEKQRVLRELGSGGTDASPPSALPPGAPQSDR